MGYTTKNKIRKNLKLSNEAAVQILQTFFPKHVKHRLGESWEFLI